MTLLIAVLAADGDLPPPARVEAAKLTGFQRATWGMSFANVKKLYPKGWLEKEKDGTKLYVDMTVAELAARVVFAFGDDDHLGGVSVAFMLPQKGFSKPEQVCDAVGRALREKFGDTKRIEYPGGNTSRWVSDSTSMDVMCSDFVPAAINYVDRRISEAPGRKVKADDL